MGGKIVPYVEANRFDYSTLPAAEARELREIAARTRQRLDLLKITVFEIGRDMIEAKRRLPWGKFEEWCEEEFKRSSRLARYCKGVVERLGDNSEIFSELPRSVLYKLASPSIPQEILDSVITQVRSGAKVTLKDLEKLIAAYRGEPADDNDPTWTLEKAVQIVRPALNCKPAGVVGIGMLWFTGRTILAYKHAAPDCNVLAIEAPFETGAISGGVNGKLLPYLTGELGQFQFVRADVGGILRSVDSRATATFPVLPLDQGLFFFPDLPATPTARFDAVFLAAMGKILRMQPRGDIAVVPEGDRVFLHASNARLAIALLEGWNANPTVIPREFCERLVSLCTDGGELFIVPECAFMGWSMPAIVAVASSGVRLCTLLHDDETRPMWPDILPEPLDLAVDLHALLKPLIAEAQSSQALAKIIRDASGQGMEEYERGVVNLAVAGETMRMWIGVEENPAIEIRAALARPHPPIRGAYDAELLRRGLSACDMLAVSKAGLVMMSHSGAVRLVPAATQQGDGEIADDVVLDDDEDELARQSRHPSPHPTTPRRAKPNDTRRVS